MTRLLSCVAVLLFTGATLMAADGAANTPAAPGSTVVSETKTETTVENAAPAVPRFYTRAEALWLQLNPPRSQTLATDSSIGDQPVLDAHSLRYTMEAGPRVTVGVGLNDKDSIEGTFFGFYQWTSTDSAHSSGESLNPGWKLRRYLPNEGAFTIASKYIAKSETEMQSAEINFRRQLYPFFSGLAGIRYINVDDHFQLQAFDDWDDLNDRNDPTELGIFTSTTRNNMVGPQIGGDLDLPLGGKTLRLGAPARMGLLANFIDYEAKIHDVQNGNQDYRFKDSTVGLAGVLELGLNLTWQFLPNWSVRGGYNLMWIAGVARAAEQSAPTVNHDGTMFLHGPSIGLEGHW